ncbi:MAG: hypothetical protein ACKOAH_06970, partial [Pirellula sp.]
SDARAETSAYKFFDPVAIAILSVRNRSPSDAVISRSQYFRLILLCSFSFLLLPSKLILPTIREQVAKGSLRSSSINENIASVKLDALFFREWRIGNR